MNNQSCYCYNHCASLFQCPFQYAIIEQYDIMLPHNLNKFFWDVRPETIDQKTNKKYIISRLLEWGDETAVSWLEKTYSVDELCQTITTSRSLSAKSRTYWKLKYHLA